MKNALGGQIDRKQAAEVLNLPQHLYHSFTNLRQFSVIALPTIPFQVDLDMIDVIKSNSGVWFGKRRGGAGRME